MVDKATIAICKFEIQVRRDKYCMKNSRTGAKYSPRRRSGTKRNFNSGRISVILMAVARRGGISAKLDLTETVIYSSDFNISTKIQYRRKFNVSQTSLLFRE